MAGRDEAVAANMVRRLDEVVILLSNMQTRLDFVEKDKWRGFIPTEDMKDAEEEPRAKEEEQEKVNEKKFKEGEDRLIRAISRTQRGMKMKIPRFSESLNPKK